MVFSSLLFVFAFFTPHLVVYFFAPKEKKNLVLLVSSLIFYAWGGPKYLLLLMLETFISWYFALNEGFKEIETLHDCRMYLFIRLVGNI